MVGPAPCRPGTKCMMYMKRYTTLPDSPSGTRARQGPIATRAAQPARIADTRRAKSIERTVSITSIVALIGVTE